MVGFELVVVCLDSSSLASTNGNADFIQSFSKLKDVSVKIRNFYFYLFKCCKQVCAVTREVTVIEKRIINYDAAFMNALIAL